MRGQMPIDAIGRDVQFAVGEPFDVEIGLGERPVAGDRGRARPIEALGRLIQPEAAGVARRRFVQLGIGLGVEAGVGPIAGDWIDFWIGHHAPQLKTAGTSSAPAALLTDASRPAPAVASAAEEGQQIVGQSVPMRGEQAVGGAVIFHQLAVRDRLCRGATGGIDRHRHVGRAVDDQSRHAEGAEASVGFSPACIAVAVAASSTASLTGWLITPTPKNCLKKVLRKKCARSFWMFSPISARSASATPFGLSSVFSI
ncbi:hypothetical protein WR25_04330 [Diploscapter pachys]|uniref:Uncharacterized protein n=1 Tax=Diploscapter pachys TaxID=2018661 RepID=A0A2A2M468_9BILA|nr:hypothetical protein WR25_04330 [Diploscapter pachys]